MKAYWRQLAARLDARTPRERGLVLLAVLAVIVGVWVQAVLDAQLARAKTLAEEQAAVAQKLTAVQLQADAVRARAEADPNKALRTREAQLRAEIEKLDRELRAKAGDFVAPDQMARALRDLLAAQGGLRLVRLETIAPQALQAGADEQTVVPVYRHGLELEFVGDYRSTVKFLEAVEQMPWRFFWDELDYQVERYPTARVRLRIHTLSGREAWIGV